MFLYFSKEFSATAAGSTLRAVICEKCGGDYFYELSRVGVGSGTSPYYLNDSGAQARADRRAQQKLDAALRASADPVPCPHCGWLQEQMVREVRRRWLKGVRKWAAIALFAGLIVLLVVFQVVVAYANHLEQYRVVLLAIAIGLAAATLALWLWVPLARRAFDPNERLPGGARRHAIPPAPPALVRTPWPERVPEPGGGDEDINDAAEMKRTHALLLPPAEAIEELRGSLRDGWVTVQLQRVGWADACELCLATEPQSTYFDAVPFKVSEASGPLKIPLCGSCRRRLRRRWWKCAGLVTVGVVGLSYFGLHQARMDETGRTILMSTLVPLAALICATVVSGALSAPHKVRPIDAGRGFFRLWFENPGYAELMAALWAAPRLHAVSLPLDQADSLLAAAAAAGEAARGRARQSFVQGRAS